MPRSRRAPKRRTGAAVDIPPALYVWLLWRNFQAACDAADDNWEGISAIYFEWHKEREHWAAIEADAVAEWIDSYPGTRPPLWWYYSAPELRQLAGGEYLLISGAKRCHETGIPYISTFEADPPMVETTPAYLERLGLWLPGERVHVPAAAFAPQRFSYGLTVAPREPRD